MTTVLRWTGAIGALIMLLLVVPLPHVEEVRGVAAQSPVCEANPQAANLNFVLKDADGQDFNLASQKGKVILLDFWATWCPPCKVEIPWFVEFQQRYGPKGLVVIGVSVDDPAASLKPFGQKYKVNYPLLVGDGRDDIKGPRAYNASWGLPKTFVIGRDGKICKAHVGLSSKEHFEQQIKSLL